MFKIDVPDVVGEANVIGYAIINLITLKGIDQKLACFAVVCQYQPGKEYYLFYCDDKWAVIADTLHITIEDAQEQAEYDYHLVADKWCFK